MSRVARKSRNRLAILKVRVLNSITGWDDTDSNTVFVSAIDAMTVVRTAQQFGLGVVDLQTIDDGVLVRLRRKEDADYLRRLFLPD